MYNENNKGPRTEPWGTPNRSFQTSDKVEPIFTPQPLRTVGVFFSPMVSGWAGGKKFVWAVSQKP